LKTLKWALFAACLFMAAAVSSARADDAPKTGFLDLAFKDSTGKEVKYVLFVPHDYKGEKAYPLILFLHGSGETFDGKNEGKQAKVGIGTAVKKEEKTFPAFVLMPQAQKRGWQADGEDAQRALDILKSVETDYKIDDKRLYLTGLSMGGFGTWSLAAKYPDKWAAIVPICGGGNVKDAATIKAIPCWCFHGDADKSVSVDRSRAMIKALTEAGGEPKYDEYPGVGHNSWDKAYATKELYEWLFKQQKK
jgi:predicted peptidase